MTILEEMSNRISGEVDIKVVGRLDALLKSSPDIFLKLKSKIDAYPKPGRIPEQELIKIETAAVREALASRATVDAANNICITFSAVARITKSVSLGKAAQFSQLSVDLTKNLFAAKDLISSGAASFASMANPTLALCGIALQMFGTFMSRSGPSVELIMLQQLQMVSQQIADLHNDMLKQFGDVHEHLRLMHETIFECADDIKFLVINEVRGFRADAIDRLAKIDASIESLRRELLIANRDILTQDLKTLCTRSDARINRHAIDNEKADVQDIAHKLERDWILGQCYAFSLNGRGAFVGDNTHATHNNDSKILNPNIDDLQNILGYIVLTAQELGLDLYDDADGIAPVDGSKIINIEVFNVAVTEYLKLRRTFPSHVKDNDKGEKYLSINKLAENTINFVTKVQRSEKLFNALFLNYKIACLKVQHAIEEQKVKANAEFRTTFTPCNFDFIASYDDIMLSAEMALPDLFMPTTGGQDQIQKDWLPAYRNNFVLPPEISIAKVLKLGGLSGTYVGEMTFSSPIPGTNRHPLPPCNPGFTANRTFPLQPGFLQQHAADSVYNYNTYRNRAFLYIYNLTMDFKINFGGNNFERTFTVKASQPFTLEASEPVNIYAKLHRPTEKDILHTFTFSNSTNCAENDEKIAIIRDAIKNKIIQLRKVEIVQRLLANEHDGFNRALLHLESAKRRLQAFSLIAGLPVTLNEAINNIPGSEGVLSELRQYLLSADMDTPYWNIPDSTSINTNCIQLIQDNCKAKLFISSLENKIRETSAQVSVHRAMYLNTPEARLKAHSSGIRPYITPNVPEAAEDRARALGFKLDDLEHQFTNSKQNVALIEAIINGDREGVSLATDLSLNVNLKEKLTRNSTTFLHLAAYIGNVNIVEELLSWMERINSTINMPDLDKFTPLMYAAMSGQEETVKLLIAHQADLNIKNRYGRTAMQLAEELGHVEILEILKDAERPRRVSSPAGW